MAKFDSLGPIQPPEDQSKKFRDFTPIQTPPTESSSASKIISQRGEPIPVTYNLDRSELGKVFVDAPLRKTTEIGPATRDVLTNADASQVEALPFHHGSIMFGKDNSWVCICCPSEESIQHKQMNQDRAGVVFPDEDRILVLQADGVGQSVDGQNAAGYAVRTVLERGTNDLSANLNQVGNLMSHLGNSLIHEPAEQLPDLLKQARQQTKETHGSNTTLNQFMHNRATGVVRGLVLGDGGYRVLRSNGQMEQMTFGTHQQRLSTISGIRQEPGEFGA